MFGIMIAGGKGGEDQSEVRPRGGIYMFDCLLKCSSLVAVSSPPSSTFCQPIIAPEKIDAEYEYPGATEVLNPRVRRGSEDLGIQTRQEGERNGPD